MSRLIKRSMLLLPMGLLLVSPVLAQGEEPVGPASFIGSYTLWTAILIGFAASLATLFYARQLKGGIVSSALTLFGAGMFLVVLGFLVVVLPWSLGGAQALVHDLFFILGYVLMLLGATRLRQLT